MNNVNSDNICAGLYKEYPYEKDAINQMLKNQNDFQEFLNEKRNMIYPTSTSHSYYEKIYEAIYNFNSTTVEFQELMERFFNKTLEDKGKMFQDPVELMEMQMEVIDMWHFIMNQLLFTGCYKIPILTLEQLYVANASLDNAKDVMIKWADFTYHWGCYINHLPYKKWKTYELDKLKIDEKDLNEQIYHMMSSFIRIAKFFKISTPEYFYSLYRSKLEENYNRQKPGGKYAK